MSFVTDLVLHRIKDHLTLKMQTEIAEGDVTRAGVVKIGRFQQDPDKATVYISCNFGDPTNPDLLDCNTSVVSKHKDNTGIDVPGYAIGGGSMWWRTIYVQFGCFFVNKKLKEEEAQEKASEVLGRLLENLANVYISDIADSHGERAIYAVTYGNTMFESGGPSDQYIWRGTVRVDFLTERPY